MKRLATWTLLLSLGIFPATSLAQPVAKTATTQVQKNSAAIWKSGDIEDQPIRYAVQMVSFPSSTLAEGVASTMRNLDWKPVRVVTQDGSSSVMLGNFSRFADAAYIAEELDVQKLSVEKIVILPRGTQSVPTEIEGPTLPAFAVVETQDSKNMTWERINARLESMSSLVGGESGDELQFHLNRLNANESPDIKAASATFLADFLMTQHEEPETCLYLAGNVARNVWKGSSVERLRCAEIVADLLYGYRRDWRGAWAASNALLHDADRSIAGKSRDQLRMIALEVELASGPESPRPSWGSIRSHLREAYDATPVSEQRLLCKMELVNLQTFAWEGDWARVEELAQLFLSRYAEIYPGESSLARLQLAQSLERKEDYEGALEILGVVLNTQLSGSDQLYMGTEARDFHADARTLRNRFVSLSAGIKSEESTENAAVTVSK